MAMVPGLHAVATWRPSIAPTPP